MKRLLIIPGLVVTLLLSGCLPSFGVKEDELIQDNEERVVETVIIPDIQLKDEYYRTLLPFKKSASRGLIVNKVRTKYDIQEAEEGLLRIAVGHFDTENHYFQEGQYIDRKTAESWLGRVSEDNPMGLNPAAPDGLTEDELAKEAPIYLAHIVEQNFLVMTEEKNERKVRLAGISIGLALNSIHYTRSGSEVTIDIEELEKEGKRMGEEIIRRIRSQEGLEDIPIVVGLFKQESRNSIVPGTYIAEAIAEKGQNAVSGWKMMSEKYVIFPAAVKNEIIRDDDINFRSFKQSIDDYFPSFVNVIGRALYKDNLLSSLEIEIPIQFFGTSETIGFTQFVTGEVLKKFPNIQVEVSITSVNGPEALIVKEPKDEDPFVHIYSY